MFDRNQNILPTTKNIEQTSSNMHATRSNVVDPTNVFNNVWTCSRGLTLTCRPPFKKSRGISNSQLARYCKILMQVLISFSKAQNLIERFPLCGTRDVKYLFYWTNSKNSITKQSNLLKNDAKYPCIPKKYILITISTVKTPKNNLFAIICLKQKATTWYSAIYVKKNAIGAIHVLCRGLQTSLWRLR